MAEQLCELKKKGGSSDFDLDSLSKYATTYTASSGTTYNFPFNAKNAIIISSTQASSTSPSSENIATTCESSANFSNLTDLGTYKYMVAIKVLKNVTTQDTYTITNNKNYNSKVFFVHD